MIPAFCRTKHDPENSTYGDCVRACVASVLNLDTEKVPHFFIDNCDGLEGMRRVKVWLETRSLVPFWSNFDGDASMTEIFEFMEGQNSTVHYLLFGRTSQGNHVVVCRGGHVVHDPAWFRSPLIGAADNGYWSVMVIAVA